MRLLGAAFGLALILGAALPNAADAASVVWAYPVGNEPFGVTIDPSDGRIYVANSDGGTNNPGFLSVVDPALSCSPSSCPLTQIALDSSPTMSALDRGLGRLFVTTHNRTLTFVDIATQSVVNRIPNAGMLGVAVDEATHRVYAASETSLSMVDGVTGSVLHTATVTPGDNDNWWAVALDAGAHRVYVTNLDMSAPSLVIFDADDLSFVGEVLLPEVPRLALAVDTARQLVYVGGYSTAGRLYVVDATLRRLTRALDLQTGGSFPLSATLVAAEDRLYLSQSVEYGPNSIVVLDLGTQQVVQRVLLPWQPGQIALHANGRLYVAELSDQRLAAIDLMNTAPVIDSVTFSPAQPTTDVVLRANVGAHDPDGESLTYSYEWSRNGVIVAGATGSSFDLLVAGHGDRGDTIAVRVTAIDPEGLATSAGSSVLIANAPPALTLSLSSTSPGTNDVLVANAAPSDADGDPVTVTYEWARNGVAIPGATTASLDLGVYGDEGDRIAVSVTASDDHGAVRVATAVAFVLPGSGTFLYLKSQPGDYIGQGAEELYTSTNSFIDGSLPQGGSTFNARVVQGNYVDWWYVTIAAPIGQPLAVGHYGGAVRAAFRPAGTPGLDINGNGRGCNELTGQFDVTAVSFSSYGDVSLFDATFEQHCEGGTTALTGRIRLEIPPPTPGVTLPPGSMTVPTSGTFLYMNQPNTTGGSYEQLYTSADSTFNPSFAQGANLFYSSVIQGNYVHWWYVNIAAPLGQPLTTGSYVHAVRAMSRTAISPGLDISGDGMGCNEIKGKFDVDELSFAPSGELLVFQATFEQWCDSSFTARYGRIRIQNAPPIPPVTLAVTVREEGSASSKTGVATISGTVSCSRVATVEVGGTLTQQVTKRVTVTGAFSTTVACTAPSVTWSATVTGEGGRFGPGQATVVLTATACEPQCVHSDATRTVKLNSSK